MKSNWTPEELTFLAEEQTIVKISPFFSINSIKFISGTYGPFKAGREAKVPLWLALFLTSNKSCNMIPPKWLNVSSLKKIAYNEQQDKNSLSKINSQYMEISYAFFNRSPHSINELDQVRSLISDIWARRTEKIRQSIILNSHEEAKYLSFPNATSMEIHLFREPVSQIASLLTNLFDKTQI